MASAMYCLSPIVDSSTEMSLPTCMYRMQPINQEVMARTHPSPTPKQEAGGCTVDMQQVQQLERRQQALLTRLTELRSQVEATQQQLGDSVTRTAGAPSSATAQPADGTLLHHQSGPLVVLASAAWPPLSLLALPPLLPTLSVTSHLHSSAPETEVPDQLRHLFSWRARQQPQTHLRVIWKSAAEVSEPVLLAAPASQACPLSGENQLCRYLARAFLPHHYEAAGLERAAAVDELLEHAYQLRHGAGKQRQAAVKAVQAALSSAPFLLGGQQTLVDGAVWSALRTSKLQTPPAVTAWLARMHSVTQTGEDLVSAENFGSRVAEKTTTNSGSRGAVKPTTNSGARGAVKTTTNSSSRGAEKTTTKSAGKPTAKERKTSPVAPPVIKAAAAAVSAAAPVPAAGHRSQLGLLHYLTRRDVSHQTVEHPAVMTVDAMMPYLQHVSGGLTKNLFLRDKKKALYMLTTPHDAQFRLSDAAAQVPGAKEFRFAEESLLGEVLGIRPGCVSPFALINDRGGRVRLLLDRRLMDDTYDCVWLHPLTNTATTGVRPADLARFLRAIEHQPTLLNLK